MKSRTFYLLLAVLAALIVIIRLADRKASPPGDHGVGARVLPFDDLNRVQAIRFSSGVQTVELANVEGTWRVPGRFNHPADLDRIADELRRLDDLKTGPTVRGGQDHLAEFGLDLAAKKEEERPVTISLRDASGRSLADVFLGKARHAPAEDDPMGGSPDSQYVRVDHGPVFLINQYIEPPSLAPGEWLDRHLTAIPRAEVKEVQVVDRAGLTYTLEQPSNQIYVAKQKAVGEELKPEGAGVVFGALEYLSALDVSGSTGRVAGALSGAVGRYVARTAEGITYAFTFGTQTVEEARNVQVEVSFTPPPPPAQASLGTNDLAAALAAHEKTVAASRQKAQEEQARLGPWIYRVADTVCLNMTLPREQVLAVPPPPAPAATNAAAQVQSTPAAEEAPTPVAAEPVN